MKAALRKKDLVKDAHKRPKNQRSINVVGGQVVQGTVKMLRTKRQMGGENTLKLWK